MKKIGSTLKSYKALIPSPELREVQELMPIDPEDRERLKKDIEKNGVRDPLKCYQEGSAFYIIGGLNRWEIAAELKITDPLPVDVYEGTEQERKDLAIQDNLNRRHLDNDHKTKLAEYFLKRDPKKSNSHIAKKTGLSDKTVNKVRRGLEGRSEIPNVEKRTDTRGRQQPVKKTPPPTKPKKSKEETPGPHHYIVNAIYAGKLDFHQLNHITVKVIEEALGKLGGQERIDYINNIKTLLKRLNV